MHTYQVNRLAVGEFAKATREALRSLGYPRSLRWIQRQTEPPRDVSRLDFYGAFIRWFIAIWNANRAGAEFLFEDFRSRVLVLRSHDELTNVDWYSAVARCESEHSEALQAAILNRDDVAIKKELADSIVANRKLLAIVEARSAAPGLDVDGQGFSRPSSCGPVRHSPHHSPHSRVA